jgi:hypothetical protein
MNGHRLCGIDRTGIVHFIAGNVKHPSQHTLADRYADWRTRVFTDMPRDSPSVGAMETVRTQLLPSDCSTSSTTLLAVPSTSSA